MMYMWHNLNLFLFLYVYIKYYMTLLYDIIRYIEFLKVNQIGDLYFIFYNIFLKLYSKISFKLFYEEIMQLI